MCVAASLSVYSNSSPGLGGLVSPPVGSPAQQQPSVGLQLTSRYTGQEQSWAGEEALGVRALALAFTSTLLFRYSRKRGATAAGESRGGEVIVQE